MMCSYIRRSRVANSIKPTKPGTLVGTGVVVALLTWSVVRIVYGDIPPLHWYTSLWAAVIAAAEATYGAGLRRRIKGEPGTFPPDPLSVARTVAYAKASAIIGSGLVGLWLGFGAYTASQLGFLQAAPSDTVTAAIGVVCAGALVAAGLFMESCCRIRTGADDGPGNPA